MAEPNTSDDFLPIADRYAKSVRRWDNPARVYGCDVCGCIFIPEAAEGEVYPDRYELANGCDDHDCPCHAIPRMTDTAGTEDV